MEKRKIFYTSLNYGDAEISGVEVNLLAYRAWLWLTGRKRLQGPDGVGFKEEDIVFALRIVAGEFSEEKLHALGI